MLLIYESIRPVEKIWIIAKSNDSKVSKNSEKEDFLFNK